MIFTLGILLVGGHFMACIAMATLLSGHQSGWVLVLLLAYAALTGILVLNLQTKLERFMIARHISKRPNSSWRVLNLKN